MPVLSPDCGVCKVATTAASRQSRAGVTLEECMVSGQVVCTRGIKVATKDLVKGDGKNLIKLEEVDKKYCVVAYIWHSFFW